MWACRRTFWGLVERGLGVVEGVEKAVGRCGWGRGRGEGEGGEGGGWSEDDGDESWGEGEVGEEGWERVRVVARGRVGVAETEARSCQCAAQGRVAQAAPVPLPWRRVGQHGRDVTSSRLCVSVVFVGSVPFAPRLRRRSMSAPLGPLPLECRRCLWSHLGFRPAVGTRRRDRMRRLAPLRRR